jgi:GDP-L-fucose synthase
MEKTSKIYIAGHRGLVGSAILRRLQSENYTNLITRTHKELDLIRQTDVEDFFTKEHPEYVFLAAAKVGGIWANKTYPADFIYNNLAIQTNVIHAAWKTGVKGLLFLGSSCIYPKLAPQPIKEEYFLSGPLEPTNEPYAIAKIAGIELCDSYNRLFRTHFLSVMPNNLYGPNDNYDLQESHVLPALIRKFYLAKLATKGDWEGIKKDESLYGPIPQDIMANLLAIAQDRGKPIPDTLKRYVPSSKHFAGVTLWGSGTPRREFLHVDDLADACVFLMNLPRERFNAINLPSPDVKKPADERSPRFVFPLINIGCGKDMPIRQLADLVAKLVGYSGEVKWDMSKPDGTPQKLLDITRLTSLGWKTKISLEEGIKHAYMAYLNKRS